MNFPNPAQAREIINDLSGKIQTIASNIKQKCVDQVPRSIEVRDAVQGDKVRFTLSVGIFPDPLDVVIRHEGYDGLTIPGEVHLPLFPEDVGKEHYMGPSQIARLAIICHRFEEVAYEEWVINRLDRVEP